MLFSELVLLLLEHPLHHHCLSFRLSLIVLVFHWLLPIPALRWFKPVQSEYCRRFDVSIDRLFSVLLGSDNLQRSASLPIVPLSPGGLLIPFQPNLSAGRRAGPFPRLGGYPSALKNFQDIRQQIEQRSQLLASLPRADRAPSPPVLSTGSLGKMPYTSPLASLAPASPAGSGPYGRTGLNYSPPSLSGSVLSGQTNPYRIVRP